MRQVRRARVRQQRHVEWVHSIRWPNRVRHHPTWPGIAALVVGVGASSLAHVLARSAADGSSRAAMLEVSMAVLVALTAAAAGADLLLLSVRSRRVFLRSSMLFLSVAFVVVAAVFFVPVLLLDAFEELATTGRLTAREIAGVGAIAATLTTVGFAAVAARTAWKSIVAERTWMRH